MISKYGFSNNVFYNQKFFHTYKNKEEDGVYISKDPTIHQRILIYQSLDFLESFAAPKCFNNINY